MIFLTDKRGCNINSQNQVGSSVLSILSAFILIYITIATTSCNTTKFLNEDEALVKRVKVEINTEDPKVKQKDLVNDLKRFIQQKPNSKKLIFVPSEYGYFKAAEKQEKLEKYDGELPSIYNKQLAEKSAILISQYLNNQKGYYNSKVTFNTEILNKYAYTTYNVHLGQRYYIESVDYYTQDKSLLQQLDEIKKKCIVHAGDPIDDSKIIAEKNRIVAELQNRGYADFAPNFINIVGDSIQKKYTIDIIFEIIAPLPDTSHNVYTVGKVKVYTDYYNKQDTTNMKMEILDGITYFAESKNFLVKPSVLNKYISFRTDELVNRLARTKTYKKITNLPPYRFSAIIPKPNTTDSSKIDFDIQLTPYPRKWTADYGFDFFNSTITRSSTNNAGTLLGFGLIAQMSNRNFLGGAERLDINAEASSQFQLGGSGSLIRTLNLSLSNNLTIPVFKDPIKMVKLFNKAGIIKNDIYSSIKTDGTSNLNLSVADLDIRDLYKIFSTNVSFGYRFSDEISRTLTINQMGLSINDYTTRPVFDTIIKNNPLIQKSFDDNLLSGIVFKDLVFFYNGLKNYKGLSFGFIANIEQSGAEVLLANKIANLISGSSSNWSLNFGGQKFNFSKFIKVDIDGRMNKTLGPKTSFASRLNIGVIRPYSNTESAPFLKQLFVGGPNSMRAWVAREIGPGKTVPDQTVGILPYAQGDFKLEFNVEYRFDIWRPYTSVQLEGALFTDIGNVWNIGAKDYNFTFGFANDLAIAAGYGLRFDLSFFIIRFDFAYKIRKPYVTDAEPFKWYSGSKIVDQGLGTIQVGINYPF